MTSKLQNTQQSLSGGQTNAAVNELQAFMNAVQAQRGKKITPAAANALIAQAQAIIAQIRVRRSNRMITPTGSQAQLLERTGASGRLDAEDHRSRASL